jgi:outer membrane lipoprotein SlyB
MKKLFVLSVICLLTACTQKPGQDVYKVGEVGKSRAVEFGTVLNVREVTIAADNKGMGTLIGAGAGGGGASYVGDGSGSVWAAAGGAIAGAVIGSMIEEELGKNVGYEYTIEIRNGDVKMIVQEKIEGDKVFKAGDKVMLQYCDAGNEHVKRCAAGSEYQRLLPVQKFPSKTKKSTTKKTEQVEEN